MHISYNKPSIFVDSIIAAYRQFIMCLSVFTEVYWSVNKKKIFDENSDASVTDVSGIEQTCRG